MERRFNNGAGRVTVETRADGSKRITGYAAVYYRAGDAGTEYPMFSDLVERIRPGAFDTALRESDVRGLFNHDPSHILGRTSAGTMRLTTDATGLRYEIDVPDTTDGADVAESVRRGDVTGSSFSFSVRSQTWEEGEGGVAVRWLNDVELYDVGPVTFPAYEATTASARDMDGVWEEARKFRDAKRAKVAVATTAARMRVIELNENR